MPGRVNLRTSPFGSLYPVGRTTSSRDQGDDQLPQRRVPRVLLLRLRGCHFCRPSSIPAASGRSGSSSPPSSTPSAGEKPESGRKSPRPAPLVPCQPAYVTHRHAASAGPASSAPATTGSSHRSIDARWWGLSWPPFSEPAQPVPIKIIVDHGLGQIVRQSYDLPRTSGPSFARLLPPASPPSPDAAPRRYRDAVHGKIHQPVQRRLRITGAFTSMNTWPPRGYREPPKLTPPQQRLPVRQSLQDAPPPNPRPQQNSSQQLRSKERHKHQRCPASFALSIRIACNARNTRISCPSGRWGCLRFR